MLINEVYTAIQGEGPHIGTPCVFVRTHGCPVHCKWCDTMFTWDGSEKGKRMAIEEIADLLVSLGRDHVVVSGGEPMIQRVELKELLHELSYREFSKVEIETAGIERPLEGGFGDFVHYNVSPKLPSAKAKIQPDVNLLREYLAEPSYVFKFVVKDPTDFEAMEDLVQKLGVPFEKVYLMPEGRTALEVSMGLANLTTFCVDNHKRYRVVTRQHVTAFGGQRGV